MRTYDHTTCPLPLATPRSDASQPHRKLLPALHGPSLSLFGCLFRLVAPQTWNGGCEVICGDYACPMHIMPGGLSDLREPSFGFVCLFFLPSLFYFFPLSSRLPCDVISHFLSCRPASGPQCCYHGFCVARSLRIGVSCLTASCWMTEG